jgi:hypothetical protein
MLEQKHTLLEPNYYDANSFFLFDSIFTMDPLVYRGKQTPLDSVFVVKDFMSVWGLNDEVFNCPNLIGKYSNAIVDYYPHNLKEESSKPLFTPLYRALTHLTQPDDVFLRVDASESGTYVQWNVPADSWEQLLRDSSAHLPLLLDDNLWLDKCMPETEDKTNFFTRAHWKMLLVGEASSGMFNHKDTLRTSSYQLQIKGRKKWHICPPTQDEFVYNAGDVDFLPPTIKSSPRPRMRHATNL